MHLYDRFKGGAIDSTSLPRDVDLGRYAVENGQDLTNSIFDTGTEHYIHQELLDDTKNHSLHELFKDMERKVSVRHNNEMDIFPLIQTLEDKLEMTDFEINLCDKLPHLEQICRQPHYLLQRYIEKVNASRAKRIPSKSYRYLAAHTEDWEQKSIVAFKPKRVLNEELDLNFDVYENQLFFALVERCLKYLTGRLKEVNDISSFIKNYKKLLEQRNDTHAWYEKVARNLELIGGVYVDDNDKKEGEKDQDRAKTTEGCLRKAQKKLLQIQSSELFNDVNHRATRNIALRDTNVLVNHKDYRYVRLLWIELNTVRPEKTEDDLKIDEQIIMDGLRAYAKILFAYTVGHLKYNNILNYKLEGSYESWVAVNSRLASISFKVSPDKTFEVSIGERKLRFIVVGNVSCVDPDSLPKRTYLMCYSQDKQDRKNDKVIMIDPMDPDSVERLGLVLNKYLLSEYVSDIQRRYNYPQTLRDYIKYINAPWVSFSTAHNDYTYSFVSPRTPIDKKALSANLVVGRDIRDDQKKELLKFIDEIEQVYEKYFSQYLFCFHCQTQYNERALDTFNYLVCPDDRFVLDISHPGRIVLKNVDERYTTDDIDWGLDCMDFQVYEL